jgi:hypothetical protein
LSSPAKKLIGSARAAIDAHWLHRMADVLPKPMVSALAIRTVMDQLFNIFSATTFSFMPRIA